MIRKGLRAVVLTQFFSVLADNAVLFAAIAVLKLDSAPSWHFPLLQEFFVAAFVLLAPFVGPFADIMPKDRVLVLGSALKLAGACMLLVGLHPFLSYAVIGIGSAIFSPAKGGVLPELCETRSLLRGNSWLEVATIAGILLGALVGARASDLYLSATKVAVCVIYGIALWMAWTVPSLPVARQTPFRPGALWRAFWSALWTLCKLPGAQMSLAGTSLFWGSTAVLRFLLIAWLPYVLHVTDIASVGYMTAIAAVGIAAGAIFAGQYVHVRDVSKLLPLGIAMGATVALFSVIHSISAVIVGLLLMGAIGGVFVIPLNALLQKRGQELVGSGAAIAAQNLVDNLGMLACVGAYTLAERFGVTPPMSALGIGSVLMVAMIIMSVIYRGARGSRLE